MFVDVLCGGKLVVVGLDYFIGEWLLIDYFLVSMFNVVFIFYIGGVIWNIEVW